MTSSAEHDIRCVVVPLDGSDFSEHALEYAAALARTAGARLRLVHVHEPLPGMVVPGQIPGVAPLPETRDEDATAWAWQYLDVWAERLRTETGVEAVTEVATGGIVAALVHASRTGEADLIVMTTHGRGGFARTWLGSTADTLVRQVAVPVLLVRPTSGGTELSRELGIQRILVPLDGSALAETIIPHASAIARLVRARLTLITILTAANDALDPKTIDDTPASAYLAGLAARDEWAGLEIDTRVLTAGGAATGILHALAELQADLVAMATHGRGGLTRVLLGSVADKVLRGATVPVLLYRP
jgi:nucleotide-binding universal stress UspA family protein